MRNLNTRRWSTPATMGAGVFVVLTGLLMFFVAESPFKLAHELVGLAFSVAVVLHVLTHWRLFRGYLPERRGVGVLAAAWSAGAALVVASALLRPADAEELVLERIDGTPVSVLAPALGLEVAELVDRLAADGGVVDDPRLSSTSPFALVPSRTTCWSRFSGRSAARLVRSAPAHPAVVVAVSIVREAAGGPATRLAAGAVTTGRGSSSSMSAAGTPITAAARARTQRAASATRSQVATSISSFRLQQSLYPSSSAAKAASMHGSTPRRSTSSRSAAMVRCE